ncbi:acyl-CoA thioesterase [Variovorax sp. J22R133]|uniref:acyl-CoA thioesterase n=1 Tax=Variovorax brevis TaxID=3053503 RepID=UPI0025761BC9|nr:acyl-CoA thioesterase [Variovorax sp. J22R133]MDM0114389.1 acyl-CoA thioesterase [Variovorax sp. J22R133]
MTEDKHAIDVAEIVFPEHANHYGTLFGGNALLLMSKAAFLAARQYAKSDVVMARCSDAQFVSRVPVGSVLRLRAFVSRVGRSSMTVCVTGIAERLGEEPGVALNGVFEMVAVDAQGKPARIPHTYLKKELEIA